jgi:hypothetical protein
MRKLTIPRMASIVGFVLCTAQPAVAVPIVFPNRVAFDAAVLDITIEGWDAYAPGTVFANGTTIAGITYTSSVENAVVTSTFLTTSGLNGLGRTSSEFFDVGNQITFAFDTPLDSFGIDINTFARNTGAYTATTSAGEVVTSFLDPFPGFGTGQFVGFSTSLPFTSVTIAGPSNLPYTLDTLRLSPVPEPGSMLLVAAGFGLVVRRYRSPR